MVDYSKWDKMDFGDDDSDDEKKPKLTKLSGEKGERVTIGPGGYKVEEEEEFGTEEDEEYNEEEEVVRRHNFRPPQPQAQDTGYRSNRTTTATVQTPAPISSKVKSLDVNIENGAVAEYRGVLYCWSQTRYEVTLTLFPSWLTAPGGGILTKKDVILRYVPDTKEMTIAQRSNSANIFTAQFQYPVQTTGEIDNPWDDVFDWDILPTMQQPARSTQVSIGSSSAHSPALSVAPAVQVVLPKISPIAQATFWWKTVFLGESTQVDVTKIAGRRIASTSEGAPSSGANMVDVFQSAHETFLERLRSGQVPGSHGTSEGAVDTRIPINLGEGDDNDEDEDNT